MSTQELLNIIKSLFPEVLIQDFEHITKGYENDILVVNKTLIFRVLKNPDRTYQKEIQFLDHVRSRVWVSIPVILFRSPDFRVMWYEIIPWKELTSDVLKTFSQAQKDILARQIAEFFIAIHGVSFDPEIQALDFPRYHKIKHIWGRLQGFLETEKNPKILAFVEKLRPEWEKYQENPEDIRLLHNDLFFKNIIGNPDKKELSGIIDFSDTFYADYIVDFVALYFEDPDFTGKIMDTYEELSWVKIPRETVQLFADTFALNELYFDDIHNKPIARKIVGVWL